MLSIVFRLISCLIVCSACPFFLKFYSISGNSSNSLKFIKRLLTISWMALVSVSPQEHQTRLFALVTYALLAYSVLKEDFAKFCDLNVFFLET